MTKNRNGGVHLAEFQGAAEYEQGTVTNETLAYTFISFAVSTNFLFNSASE